MTYEVRVTDSTNQPHNLDRQDQVKEALVDEVLTFAAVGGVITELTCYDPEADCEIEGSTFTASSPGVYRLKCSGTQGVRQILVRVVTPAVLAAIPDYGFRTGYGQCASPRMALRSIANNCPAWSGTAEEFWDNRVKLADHGVVAPRN